MHISTEYLEQQKKLHENTVYGTTSLGFASFVFDLIKQTGCRSISDYGAGRCNLQKKLIELGAQGLEYFPFDPAFPEYGPPKKADLLCCIDVLEHIEPDYLDSVLDELSGLFGRMGFLTIHTGPAMKVLPDGRNAHLIQQPASWWLPRLCNRFDIAQLQRFSNGFWLIVD